MSAWWVFLVAGVGTYVSRALFILLVGDRVLPDAAERGLRNIGPAVLAALTASLLTTDGLGDFLTDPPEVAAVAAGVAVGLWRRSFMPSFGAAFATWALLSIVL